MCEKDYHIQLRLHDLFHPLMRELVGRTSSELAGLIEQKRALGWRSDFTRSLDRALSRFVSRFGRIPDEVLERFRGMERNEIEQRTSIIPGLHDEIEEACDLICVLSDLEVVHFPRWFGWLIEELKVEGLIK